MDKSESHEVGSGHVLRRKPDGSFERVLDELTVEEPLEIRIGDRALAVTMRTPGHDDELAAGFLLSEALIRDPGQIHKIEKPVLVPREENVVSVVLAPEVKLNLQTLQRFGTISSSCGLCGKTSIESVRQNFPAIESRARVSIEMLLDLPDRVRREQSNFSRTGGIHAAALFSVTGEFIGLREDVGRHNAVDKVIGRAFLDRSLPLNRHLLFVSGRASFEIVQKALAAGIAIIASVSAPSTLAANFCRENNQTLIGFLRPPSFNIYSHVERIILEEPGSASTA
jgi:FdhD protein